MKELVLFIAAAIAAFTSSSAQTKYEVECAVNACLQRQNALGVEYAVVKDGKIVAIGSAGVKDTCGTEWSADHSEIFPMASISKSYTATAVLQLVEQGKIALEDEIDKYLDVQVANKLFPDTKITVRMFLDHTSTIQGGGINLKSRNLDPEIDTNFVNRYGEYEPGSQYYYSNLCYNVLGGVVEKVSKERFDKYVKNHILNPLGLTASFNAADLDSTKFTDIWIYDKKLGAFKKKDPFYFEPMTKTDKEYKMGEDGEFFYGSYGMKTDIKSLARYMMMHMNDGELDGVRILSPEYSRLMKTGHIWGGEGKGKKRHYAFGLFESDNWIPGKTVVGHTGFISGIATAMFFNQEEGWGICTIYNAFNTQDRLAMQTDMFRTLHGLYIGYTHKD